MAELEELSYKEVIEQGIKSEMNAQTKYEAVAKANYSYALSENLRFLLKQEKQHEKQLRELFKKEFPNEKPHIPDEALKPAPDIELESESIGELLEEAMESEKESTMFYKHLADRFDDDKRKELANYLAHMERGHYKILKHQLETLKKYGGRWGEARAF